MLAKDSVKSRLERSDSGLSFTEFSYMLLQAYDFVHLNRHFGCQLQVGGSDQWGNITAGIDLGRRMHSVQLYGLTCPLLTKSDGSKMGKTESGALWLSPDRTSAFQFYQYWINVEDADAGKCLRYFTDLAQEEILALDEARGRDPGKRDSQRRLAEEITRLVHGPEGLAKAQRRDRDLVRRRDRKPFRRRTGRNLCRRAQQPARSAGVDERHANGGRRAGGIGRLAASKGEARRLVTQGGAYINNRRESDAARQLTAADLASETTMVLRTGKKKYALLRFV